MRHGLILLSIATLLSVPAGAQTCTSHLTQQRAATTLALQARLLAATSPTMDTGVPASLRPILHDFKQSLIDTVDAGLRCNQPAPERIQADLAALLHSNQPPKPQPPSDGTWQDTEKGDYGDALTIAVKPVPGRKDAISIQLSYGIACGEDSILLIYRRSHAGWQRELIWQNPDLNSTGDAFGDMYEWSLVPGPDGTQLFAGVHGTPWCTSRMSDFKVDLLSLATPGHPQKLLKHINDYYSRISDNPVAFKVTADGFQFRVEADSLDFANLFTRPRVYRFRTLDGNLTRIQPIADNARDFVDAWIQLPWAESKQWAAHPTPELQQFRNRFDYGFNRDYGEVSYGPVRACGNSLYQVQMDVSGGQANPGATLYVLVSLSPAAFTLQSVSQTPGPTCQGPDLMPKPKP